MDDHQQVNGDVQRAEGKVDYNLLEECWFFDNLLVRKTRYSRSNSDTSEHDDSSSSSSSSSISKQQDCTPTVSEVYAEIIKQENLTEQETGKSVTDVKISKQKNRHLMRGNQGLNRAPSLPANYMGMELKESRQECVPPKVSKLSRQASLTPNPSQPTKGHGKGSISRTESLNLDAINEMRSGYIKYQKNTRKTARALEYEEVQGFKELGFNFDTLDLSPGVVSILPGLQDKKKAMSNIDELEVKNEDIEEDEHHKFDKSRKNPYLSEAWQLQRSSSSISNWVVKKSSDDMKAQLKTWARTVASNVR